MGVPVGEWIQSGSLATSVATVLVLLGRWGGSRDTAERAIASALSEVRTQLASKADAKDVLALDRRMHERVHEHDFEHLRADVLRLEDELRGERQMNADTREVQGSRLNDHELRLDRLERPA